MIELFCFWIVFPIYCQLSRFLKKNKKRLTTKISENVKQVCSPISELWEL